MRYQWKLGLFTPVRAPLTKAELHLRVRAQPVDPSSTTPRGFDVFLGEAEVGHVRYSHHLKGTKRIYWTVSVASEAHDIPASTGHRLFGSKTRARDALLDYVAACLRLSGRANPEGMRV